MKITQAAGVIFIIVGVLNILWGGNDLNTPRTNTGFIIGMMGLALLVL